MDATIRLRVWEIVPVLLVELQCIVPFQQVVASGCVIIIENW